MLIGLHSTLRTTQAQGHDSNDMPPLETFQPDYSAPGFVGDEALQYDQLEGEQQQPRRRGRQPRQVVEAADAAAAAQAARAAQLAAAGPGADAAEAAGLGGAGAQLLVQQAAAAAAGAEELSEEDLLMGQEEPPGVWDYEAGGWALHWAKGVFCRAFAGGSSAATLVRALHVELSINCTVCISCMHCSLHPPPVTTAAGCSQPCITVPAFDQHNALNYTVICFARVCRPGASADHHRARPLDEPYAAGVAATKQGRGRLSHPMEQLGVHA